MGWDGMGGWDGARLERDRMEWRRVGMGWKGGRNGVEGVGAVGDGGDGGRDRVSKFGCNVWRS